jgi:hypothetical protein
VYNDTVPYFYAWKDSIIEMSVTNKKTAIYINNRLTTTIQSKYGVWGGNNISSNDKTCKDVIFAKSNQIERLSIETGQIDTILINLPQRESYSAVIGDLLIGDNDTITGSSIICFNMQTKQKRILAEINFENHNIWGIDVSATGMLFVSFGNNYETEYIDYYVFDIKNQELIKKDYSKYLGVHDNFSFSHDDISGMYMIMSSFWMDSLFNVVQPTIERISIEQRGFKLKETDFYYYLHSQIDETLRKDGSTGVWLPCRFTLPSDMCLYKIYHNQLLTKEEIAGLDQWELHKLKNMIFAKHNYEFESHYLQAFYNLFQFYNNGKKKRIKEVNHLLTTEDQENLKLINQLMK